MSEPQKFVLRSTLTSPFGRKVRMALEVLGLADRVTMVPANPLDENDTLRQQNPLGKMPCLVCPDGSTVYDSGVIIEYLQELSGGKRLLPVRGSARYKALTRARLADGIMDASILVVYTAASGPARRRRRNGWRISAARSTAGSLPSRRSCPIPAKPTWCRSVWPARSAISTGASRLIGVRPIRAWFRGCSAFPSTNLPSNALARPLRKEAP